MIYLQLFLSFLQIGAFSFGGGYAAMPLIQAQIVDGHRWLTASEFTNLITISQMTPGPIAINAATFVGTQIAGPAGALAATFGCILPSCLFVTGIAWVYTKYRKLDLLQGALAALRPAVVALIAKAGIDILITACFRNGTPELTAGNLSPRAVVWFLLGFLLLRKTKLGPVSVMVICGVLEVVAAVCSGEL